jgi:hypothetical protein
VFELPYFAADLITSNLFVERVQQLLSGRCSGKSGTVVFRSASDEVEQTFIGPGEGTPMR